MGADARAISVIVADDEPDIVEFLSAALAMEGFRLAGSAQDADGAVVLAHEERPDVALLDLRMPGGGLEAARRIASSSPTTRVVIFSAAAITPALLPLLRAGIDGYVTKGASAADIATAVRSAVSGGAVVTPEAGRLALDELAWRLEVEEQTRARRVHRHDRIRAVIDDALFSTVFQPIIDVRSGLASGLEALTRFATAPHWSPLEWFEEASRLGERTSLELATARAALTALAHVDPALCISINISPATALSGRLGEALAGVDLERVVLEVTEHTQVADYPALTAALAPWRSDGARLAVDDAGGGYASFAHILNLSPDFIKLDISLVRAIDCDTRRQALARAVCSFADELDVTVIAEGIESAAELETVTALGTPLAQGYHLGRPLPLAASASWRPRPLARSTGSGSVAS